jgi:phage gp36-like protein
MSYATKADLSLSEQILTWLTTDDAGLGLPDETVITAALAAADNRINAHLRQRYALPLADPDLVLRDLAVKLARYWLYSRRPDGPEVPESIKLDRDGAERDLRDIRDGKLSLGESPSDPVPAAELGRFRVTTPERTFTDDLLDRY